MGPMLMLEWVLVLLLAAVVLTNLAERLAVPYPSLLAIAGAGLAFLPFAPQIRIEPDLALALFVAPALLDAAFDTSPRGLRDNAIPVASMAVVAVVLTTAAIAFLGWRFAGLPIAAAIALGAIVAPPDAVAANEVLRHLRIPQRIGLVLQGESMLNDATALLIYRAAVLAARGFIQPHRRRADPGARGCGGPGRWLCVGATVSGRKRVRARPSQQHRSTIRQHLWGVASVRAPGAFTDHHGCDLRHDIGSSGSRGVGRAPAHQLLFGVGDRGLRRERAGVRADGVARPPDHRAPVTGAALGLASIRADRASRCDRRSHCLARGVQSDRCHHPAQASRPRRPARADSARFQA